MQINKFWKKLRDALKEPSQYQLDCQKPKTVLLDTGEMFWPYAWAVQLITLTPNTSFNSEIEQKYLKTISKFKKYL